MMKLSVTHCIVTKSLLNHLNSFHGGMFTLNAKSDADPLLCLLSHCECYCHTVHILTQWHLLPSLTSTVKSSLFTHAHYSPLCLAARLHRCCTNRSLYRDFFHTLNIQIPLHQPLCGNVHPAKRNKKALLIVEISCYELEVIIKIGVIQP